MNFLKVNNKQWISIFILGVGLNLFSCGKKNESSKDAPRGESDDVVVEKPTPKPPSPPVPPPPPQPENCGEGQKKEMYGALGLKKDSSLDEVVSAISSNFKKEDFWKSIRVCN